MLYLTVRLMGGKPSDGAGISKAYTLIPVSQAEFCVPKALIVATVIEISLYIQRL